MFPVAILVNECILNDQNIMLYEGIQDILEHPQYTLFCIETKWDNQAAVMH